MYYKIILQNVYIIFSFQREEYTLRGLEPACIKILNSVIQQIYISSYYSQVLWQMQRILR